MNEKIIKYSDWWISKARWVSGFWIARGIILTFSLLSTAPAFIDLSQFEFFRAAHVLLWSWREFIEFLARIASWLPWVPDISPAFIATLIFVLNLWMPTFFVANRFWHKMLSSRLRHSGKRLKFRSQFLIQTFMGLLLFAVIVGSAGSFYDIYLGGDGNGHVAFPDLPSSDNIRTLHDGHGLNGPISIGLVILFCLGVIMRHYPSLRIGILFASGTIICVELFYFLGSPWLSDDINNFICKIGEIPPERCKID